MVTLISSLHFAIGQEWSAENVPIPYLRDSTQYVSDPDGYLTKEERDSANFYLQKLNSDCGVQNVFILVGHVKNQDAFRMSQDVGAKYGIGYKSTRRGLVIVVSVEDHKYSLLPVWDWRGSLQMLTVMTLLGLVSLKYATQPNGKGCGRDEPRYI